MVDYRDLATVKQVAAEAPFITEATLRWWASICLIDFSSSTTIIIKQTYRL
jgi:hypothetical protein